MQHTIQTLLKQGKSRRAIARQLGIHRKTVKRIEQEFQSGNPPPLRYHRDKKLDDHAEMIKKAFLEDGLSGRLIWEKLKQQELTVSYTTVCRHVKKLKKEECFVPMETAPGEEAQVDFGYLGRFQMADGHWVKVWGFAIVLSFSRYAYYEAVLDQSVATFIKCHWRAFEYFNGVPAAIRLDNLKAGVIQPDFYEPLLQGIRPPNPILPNP